MAFILGFAMKEVEYRVRLRPLCVAGRQIEMDRDPGAYKPAVIAPALHLPFALVAQGDIGSWQGRGLRGLRNIRRQSR